MKYETILQAGQRAKIYLPNILEEDEELKAGNGELWLNPCPLYEKSGEKRSFPHDPDAFLKPCYLVNTAHLQIINFLSDLFSRMSQFL